MLDEAKGELMFTGSSQLVSENFKMILKTDKKKFLITEE